MRRVLACLVTSTILAAGCGQGVWLSRSDAIGRANREKGVSEVTRREAKLMTWPEFLRAGQIQADPSAAPPGKQKVWLVAVSGNVQLGGAHERWAIFVYNAVTGAAIGHIAGPSDEDTGQPVGPDWPPNWNDFPDSG
jgi:hypothetical protein